MTAPDTCARDVATVRRDDLVLDAARVMRDRDVRDAVVVERDRQPRPAGILTDCATVVAIVAQTPGKIDQLQVITFDALVGVMAAELAMLTTSCGASASGKRRPASDDPSGAAGDPGRTTRSRGGRS